MATHQPCGKTWNGTKIEHWAAIFALATSSIGHEHTDWRRNPEGNT